MSLINESLFSGPGSKNVGTFDKQQKIELIKSFWPHLKDGFPEDEYGELFQFIGETLREHQPYAEHFSFKDFQGLFDTIRFLQCYQSSTRDQIAAELKSRIFMNCSDEQIIKSMELSVRLWLGLDVPFSGTFVGVVHSRRGYLRKWKGDETLDAMADSCFEKTTNVVYTECELDDLSAAKLERVCLLHIEWTNCLNDHLKLTGNRGKRILFLYQQKSTLLNHEKAGSPIPAAALDEAIRSLELLLPTGDPETRRLLTKAGKLSLLQKAWPPKQSASNLDEFDYWKPRLRRLLNLLHGAPESFLQRLFDTRDIGQWAALWVGIFGILVLTLLFGILATVYAIKQYFLAVESYNLSVKSYELSLVLACQQAEMQLTGICG
jgi:hypothetical protein